MADFGKLNFSVSFNPTSAFPLDARCYFDSLALAKAAAATAEEVGSSNTVYYIGQRLLVREGGTGDPKWYVIQKNKTLVEEGSSFKTDETLTLQNGELHVNVAQVVEADNTLPVSSAAVYAQVGGIESILETI